jgi:hypothetical protein
MWERFRNAITSIYELCRLVEIFHPQGEYAEIGQS